LQRFGFALAAGLDGLLQIIEESGRVGITGVDLKPDCVGFGFVDITRRKRGLAGTWRTGNPYRWLLALFIKQR
jgi:hypothetical protein